MVPGWLAKARSSALGTPCVIFYKHMETHAVGKLWRNLSDLPGKRQGNRCSEAERDTEAGRLPRTRGTGTGVWSQGCREGEGSACRADHSCGVFSALPLLRGADVSSQGRSRPRRQVCGPGGEQRAAQCRRDFLTSKVLVTPHPGQQPLQANLGDLQLQGCGRASGTCGWEGRWGRNRVGRAGCLSQVGALRLAPGLLPLGKGLHLGARTPGGDPPSPPGSSAGVFRPGSALPAQAHCRVFGPNTPSSLAQPLV